MEDYLEAVALLKRSEDVVRVSRIARLLKVKNPSVHAAIEILSAKGLVRHEKYGCVELTASGEKAARGILRRHDALLKFITSILGVDAETARRDACGMEHAVSSETLERLTKFIEFAGDGFGEDVPRWLENFRRYLKTGKSNPCPRRKGRSVAAKKTNA